MPDEIFSDEYLKKCWNILDKKTKFIFLLIMVHFIIIFLFFSNFFFSIFGRAVFKLISNYVGWVSWIISLIIILYCRNRSKYYKDNILIKIVMVLSSICLILYFVVLILMLIFLFVLMKNI